MTWLGRLRVTAGVVLHGIPFVLGVKKPGGCPHADRRNGHPAETHVVMHRSAVAP